MLAAVNATDLSKVEATLCHTKQPYPNSKQQRALSKQQCASLNCQTHFTIDISVVPNDPPLFRCAPLSSGGTTPVGSPTPAERERSLKVSLCETDATSRTGTTIIGVPVHAQFHVQSVSIVPSTVPRELSDRHNTSTITLKHPITAGFCWYP
nr:unnamed protein product [Callosobruchus chinensis]